MVSCIQPLEASEMRPVFVSLARDFQMSNTLAQSSWVSKAGIQAPNTLALSSWVSKAGIQTSNTLAQSSQVSKAGFQTSNSLSVSSRVSQAVFRAHIKIIYKYCTPSYTCNCHDNILLLVVKDSLVLFPGLAQPFVTWIVCGGRTC